MSKVDFLMCIAIVCWIFVLFFSFAILLFSKEERGNVMYQQTEKYCCCCNSVVQQDGSIK